jgi:hypothetical protein
MSTILTLIILTVFSRFDPQSNAKSNGENR